MTGNVFITAALQLLPAIRACVTAVYYVVPSVRRFITAHHCSCFLASVADIQEHRELHNGRLELDQLALIAPTPKNCEFVVDSPGREIPEHVVHPRVDAKRAVSLASVES